MKKRLSEYWFHIQYNLHPEVYKFTLTEWVFLIAFIGFGAYFLTKALLGI